MTNEELIKQVIEENLDKCLVKVNEWGGLLTEEEKKDLFDKGGVL